jgi:hypothetical protein
MNRPRWSACSGIEPEAAPLALSDYAEIDSGVNMRRQAVPLLSAVLG